MCVFPYKYRNILGMLPALMKLRGIMGRRHANPTNYSITIIAVGQSPHTLT